MFKETSLALIVALWLFVYWPKPESRKHVLRNLTPVLVLLLFFAWQYVATGSPFHNPDPRFYSLRSPVKNLLNVAKWLFEFQGRIALSGLMVLNIAINRKAAWKPEFSLFLLIFGFYIGAFGAIYFLPRYVLIAFPYICLMGAWSIFSLVKMRVKSGLLIGALGVQTTSTYCMSFSKLPVTRALAMQVPREDCEQHRQACQYIEANFGERSFRGWGEY